MLIRLNDAIGRSLFCFVGGAYMLVIYSVGGALI